MTTRTCWAAAMCVPLLAVAQVAPLADPTRPPAFASPLNAASPGGSVVPPGRAAMVGASVPPAAPLRLQSVQVRREGHATALVDGRLVTLGDRLGDREIVAIDAQGLQLRGRGGVLQRLPLLEALPTAAPAAPGMRAPETRLAQGQQR